MGRTRISSLCWGTAGMLWSSLWRWILRLMLFKEGRATAITSLKFHNSAHKICWEVSFVFPALFLIRTLIFVASTLVCDRAWVCLFSLFRKVSSVESFPNGHIFVDSPSIRGRNSTWKVCGNYIDFERQINVEVMTSIRRVHFDVDSTFKIDEMSMSSPREFFFIGFDVESTQLLYSLFPFYHFLTFSALGTYSKLFWYSVELM